MPWFAWRRRTREPPELLVMARSGGYPRRSDLQGCLASCKAPTSARLIGDVVHGKSPGPMRRSPCGRWAEVFRTKYGYTVVIRNYTAHGSKIGSGEWVQMRPPPALMTTIITNRDEDQGDRERVAERGRIARQNPHVFHSITVLRTTTARMLLARVMTPCILQKMR